MIIFFNKNERDISTAVYNKNCRHEMWLLIEQNTVSNMSISLWPMVCYFKHTIQIDVNDETGGIIIEILSVFSPYTKDDSNRAQSSFIYVQVCIQHHIVSTQFKSLWQNYYWSIFCLFLNFLLCAKYSTCVFSCRGDDLYSHYQE